MTNSLPSGYEHSTGFDRLAEPVRRWIWDKGWDSLRDIQERAIHILMNDNSDVIIAAPTAGGKTEAAFLPLISSVLEAPNKDSFDLVYIGPLRALINDQFRRLEDLCASTDLPVYPWHGDISQSIKSRARKNPGGVLLITPESLEALFVLRGLEVPTLFAGTRAIVIDELHSLLDNERGVHLRSLLSRVELAANRKIRRIGLSATLSEMDLVKAYLRPESPESVALLESNSERSDLRVQIRGYLIGADDSDGEEVSAKRAVAEHLFSNLRGTSNLVFAGSRQNVEWYSDALRALSEKERVPLEFFPHHASLSREHRLGLEERLKSPRPTTAICTSTLELGIDIGDIVCVAQIGAPFSVSSLQQRLGRSGRLRGQPSILRMYAIEAEAESSSHPLDRLHLGLIRSIAMTELLIERWCEPPAPQALHLSTLTHQILSVIAEHGGVRAERLFNALCKRGPFRQIDPSLFASVLRHLGRPDVALIEQAPDGILLLGARGEKLVEHYSFYAVFQTPEEYRIIADGKLLGTLPSTTILAEGMSIIFSGRRWRITKVHDTDKVIEVTADRVGRTPPFSGHGGLIHDRVVEKMRDVLSGERIPTYLDNGAKRILNDARSEFRRLGLDQQSICKTAKRGRVIATWAGSIKTSTLALRLRAMGYSVAPHDGFLDVNYEEGVPHAEEALREIATSAEISAESLLPSSANLVSEKFHPYLNRELLLLEAASGRLELGALSGMARRIIEE